MDSKIISILLGGLAVSACQRSIDVEVRQQSGRVIFVASRSGKPPCIDEVSVYKADDLLNPVWKIGAQSGAPCRSAFVYGEEVPSYLTDGPPPRLASGVSYSVSMRGPGLVGDGDFVKAK